MEQRGTANLLDPQQSAASHPARRPSRGHWSASRSDSARSSTWTSCEHSPGWLPSLRKTSCENPDSNECVFEVNGFYYARFKKKRYEEGITWRRLYLFALLGWNRGTYRKVFSFIYDTFRDTPNFSSLLILTFIVLEMQLLVEKQVTTSPSCD